jgi:hypothetical protein
MIIQTRDHRSAHAFRTVLRGEVVGVDAAVDGHVPLRCHGKKRETGELYTFRVMLNEVEFERIARVAIARQKRPIEDRAIEVDFSRVKR